MRIVLLLSCLCGILPPGPAPVRVAFSPLTKAAYVQARKAQIVTKPRVLFPLKKSRGRIVIPMVKGQKVFADIDIDEAAIEKGHGEEESTIYTYRGYLVDFNCHLVQVQFYETTQWILIDQAGQQLALWGEPIVSPDKRSIVATCMGIEYGGGQPNIIQLLSFRNGTLREVWSLEPKTWEPYRICWTSASTLLLSKEMWTGKNPGNSFTYAKLTVD